MRIVHRAARWTFGAVVAGSLSFGVSQAVASPSADGDARVCNSSNCPQSICKCVSGQCVDRVGGFWCFA
jgi:hypothetical protein